MEIILKRLTLENFKGIKHLVVPFNETLTTIYGDNEAGKTTIFDAFYWLLFNKDSQERTSFEIKTLDKDNNPMRKLLHSVEGEFFCDGMKKVFRKEYSEKWQKKRGEQEEEFTGHETAHFIDLVPVSKKDYDEVISKIIPEAVFRLITNPFLFANMKREEKRKMVLQVAGEPSLEQVAGGIKKFEAMINALEGRDIDSFKKVISAQKKKVKEEKAKIKPGIDENQQRLLTLPDVSERPRIEADQAAIDAEVAVIRGKKSSKQKALHSKMKEYEQLQLDKKALILKLEAEKANATDEAYKYIKELRARIAKLEEEKDVAQSSNDKIKRQHDSINEQIAEKTKLLEETRAKWYKINSSEFVVDENYLKCKECGQELKGELAFIDNQKAKFNQNKEKSLAETRAKGISISQEIEGLAAVYQELSKELSDVEKLNDLEFRIKTLQQEHNKLSEKGVNVVMPESVDLLQKELDALTAKIDSFQMVEPDTKELDERLLVLEAQKTECIQKITLIEEVVLINARIQELSELDTTYAAEIAKLEKQEFIIDEFVKRKIEMMEDSIAKKFDGVRFKMFNKLINGEEEPTCEILIKGVPYDNANRAAQINTGIKIINSFCTHYGFRAPIFIDNAEAVNKLEKTPSQLVRLVVVPAGFKAEFSDEIVLTKNK